MGGMSRQDSLNGLNDALNGLDMCGSIDQYKAREQERVQQRERDRQERERQERVRQEQRERERQERVRQREREGSAFLKRLDAFPSAEALARAGLDKEKFYKAGLLQIGLDSEKQHFKDYNLRGKTKLSSRACAANYIREHVNAIKDHLAGGKATPLESEVAIRYLIDLTCRCLQLPVHSKGTFTPEDAVVEHVLTPWEFEMPPGLGQHIREAVSEALRLRRLFANKYPSMCRVGTLLPRTAQWRSVINAEPPAAGTAVAEDALAVGTRC